jgi:hypothetical protein
MQFFLKHTVKPVLFFKTKAMLGYSYIKAEKTPIFGVKVTCKE